MKTLKVKITRDGFGPGSKSLWFLPKGVIDAKEPEWPPNMRLGTYGGRRANMVEPLLVHPRSNARGPPAHEMPMMMGPRMANVI